MRGSIENEQTGMQEGSTPSAVAAAEKGSWKPVLTLLVLSPAIGELLSGSSPPLQFFNPVFLMILMGLYGCGALLVREIVVCKRLNAAGLLLLGAAYGIVEEGLMCKSFFNPHWTDTGYLSIYGRAMGVNWVWAFGLTFYHMAISIAAPIFITEALFRSRAELPWLRRRGWIVTSSSFALVVLLGFAAFDNRQFHYVEMHQPLELARRLDAPSNALERFMAEQLTTKNRALVHKAVAGETDSPELRHALQEELNRLLPRADLYSPARFAGMRLPDPVQRLVQTQAEVSAPIIEDKRDAGDGGAAKRVPTKVTRTRGLPHGDKLVGFNRALLEAAFPGILPARIVYPFRPNWALTIGCVLVVLILIGVALKQKKDSLASARVRRPWLTGLAFTAGFVLVGFVLPGLVEHGLPLPAGLLCGMWCVLGWLLAMVLRRMDGAEDWIWRRGLWAIGAITPWVFVAMLLGIVIGMIGAKSFLGMPFVSLVFGAGIVVLAAKWKRRLNTAATSYSKDSFSS